MELRYRTNAICQSDTTRGAASPWRACLARLGAGLLAAALAFGAAPARAQDVQNMQDMSVPPPAEPPLPPLSVQARSAIIMDAVTGTVLWSKDARTRRPMASTTKIMTATLMIESGRLDDTVTFSDRARKTDYANLYVKPGERFQMSDLLYAVLLKSSNDSCVAVAEHLAGSPWKFTYQMTQKARELGAMDTNFVTTNGLYHPKHYSTAYDLAVITRHAFRYPLFNEVAATETYTIDRPLNPNHRLIKNHNKFLGKYEGADGVKTGYVSQSGRCLVASATRQEMGNPWRIITVVLNSGDTYGDSAKMQEWARKNFQPVFFARAGESVASASIRGGVERTVPLVAQDDLAVIIRRDSGKTVEREIRARAALRAPVKADQPGGMLLAMVDGRAVAQVNLVPARSVARIWTAGVADFTGWSMLFAGIVLGPRYGRRYARAFAKGARRRRRRLASRRRDPDLGG